MTTATPPTTPAAPPGGDLCRLTVCGPDSRVEVALPAHAPLAELMPSLLRHLGTGLADAGLQHDGWVLQRLGSAPLDEERSVTALGLHDGDTTYLRPRADALPPVHFDDLIDGVATGIAQRPDRWRPRYTRWLFLGLLAVPLLAGLVLVGTARPPSTAVGAGGAMLLLTLLAAPAASRAFGDRVGATLLGTAAVAHATLAASLAPAVAAGLTGAGPLDARLLAGGAAGAGAALLAAVLTGVSRPAFLAAALALALAAGGGAASAFAGVPPAGSAALVLLVVVPLGAFVPVAGFRLARMRLAPLPTTPEELQTGIEPEPSGDVLARTADAARYLTALYASLGVVAAGCLLVLALSTRSLPAHLLALAGIVVLLLHARVLMSAWQRIAVVAPAMVGALALVLALTAGSPAPVRIAALAALVVAAGLLYAGVHVLPGRKLLPYWGRAGDIAQSAAALGLLPLVLWVLDVYSYARGLGG